MNNKGSETLFQASAACKLRLVRMLVEGGTSVNVRNERLETPLMLCCQSKTDQEEKRRVVAYLLSKKAMVNLQDIDGRTALIHACLSNSGKEVIQALLDAKSNPWVQDLSKNTVFDYVINAADLETTRILINACRENMLAGERDEAQMVQLEECLVNMQDIRKFSWPLMGHTLRKNHTIVYAAEKEEPSFPWNNLLGSDLGNEILSNSPQTERRRKRSVCHFDPLDIDEILNCNEDAKEKIEKRESEDGNQSQSRKTSVRSLSEEEKFSFQISDGENTPRDPSPGLEKLLRIQDSFCSSLDSNEFPCTTNDSTEHLTRIRSVDEQVSKGSNLLQENKEAKISSQMDKNKTKGETVSLGSSDERQSFNNDSKTEDTNNEYQRLFTRRTSPHKDQSFTLEGEEKNKNQPQAMNNSPLHNSKEVLENMETHSNPYTSLVKSRQSSPTISPLSSPRLFRREMQTSVTVKQTITHRATPVTHPADQNRRQVSIVRRYTLSAMDTKKLHSSGVGGKTLLAPPLQPAPLEPDKRTGSAVFESTTREGVGKYTPPGLRKSKSDMSDWKSMSRDLQGTDFLEFAPPQQSSNQSAKPSSDNNKLEGSENAQFQLPSISSVKKGRHSPKELANQMAIVTSASDNKQSNLEAKVELAPLHLKTNADKQRLSLQTGQEFPFADDFQRRSPISCRSSLSSSPSNSFDKSDIVAVATLTDLSSKGLDKVTGDILPDLLLNCPYEGDFSKQGSVTTQTSTTFKDTMSRSNSSEERSVAGSPHGQQRTSPRLRPGTLLPPLLISNRRSPTHEIEDGYFSCSPSPADMESPRRKCSNEQLRYSFKPISPRSPVPSSKCFYSTWGKQPTSR